MNTPGHDESFDDAMRELHRQALSQVSAPTRARLRAARTPGNTPGYQHRFATRGLGWVLASGFAAVFAVAIGLQLRAPSAVPALPRPANTGAASYDADAYTAVDTFDEALEENPDFYLWLASNDDAPPDALER